jgi:DNA-binding MarR family transcriptional regulator
MQRKRAPASRNFHQLASLRVEMLARHSRRYADADFRRKTGLGVLQCRIIGVVGSQGPLSLRDLCVAADIEKTYASRLAAKLTTLGLLRKSFDTSDQRSFVIALTKAGRRSYDRIYRIALQRNETWLTALSAGQRETFFNCIDILERASKRLIAGSRLNAASLRSARDETGKRTARSFGQGTRKSAAQSRRVRRGNAPS